MKCFLKICLKIKTKNKSIYIKKVPERILNRSYRKERKKLNLLEYQEAINKFIQVLIILFLFLHRDLNQERRKG